MHASTASACLRKLSDWVNSFSKPHAADRSFIRSSLFFRVFAVSFWLCWILSLVLPQKSLDIHRLTAPDYLEIWSLTTGSTECQRSGSSQNLDGHDSCPGRLSGSRSLRPLPARSIPYNQ